MSHINSVSLSLAVADVLIDAASVLGGEATLKILYMKLVEVRSCIMQCWKQFLKTIFLSYLFNLHLYYSLIAY